MTYHDQTAGLPDPLAQAEFYDGVPTKRALAWVIDVVLIAILTALAVPLTAFLGLFFLPFLFLVIGFVYRWVTLTNGSATLGMRFMSIELRDRFGAVFEPATAFMHTAGYYVSVAIFPLQFISIALMLISEKKQGLTDHVLGTAALHRAA